MNRREKARQKKRKERERRLRQQRHAAQAAPSESPPVDGVPANDAEASETDIDAEADRDALIRHREERRLRRAARILARHKAAGPAEQDRVEAAIEGKSAEELDAEFGADPLERAQDLAFIAWESDDGAETVELIEEALTLDPACVDAQTLRAMRQCREDVRLEWLGRVIDEAARKLGEERLAGDESLWVDVYARPYLRARHARLTVLAGVGRTHEAIAEGDALIELDPEDHLRARGWLAGALLVADEIQRVRDLVLQFEDRGDFSLWWASVLERFLSGERQEAAIQRLCLRRTLPEVEELILGQREPAQPGDPAGDEMATEAWEPIARAWARCRDARRWLADGAPQSTAAERREALASYELPVSALLRLGEPVSGGPGADGSRWPDYSARHGLRAEDIPELMRMAGDVALREMDRSKPAGWAPVHAWRALAQLAAAGVEEAQDVTSVILRRVETAPNDQWAAKDAEHVLALVGEPALDELGDMLVDGMERQNLRSIAASALAAIGMRHRGLRKRVLVRLCETLADRVDHAESILSEGYVVEDELEPDEIDMIGLIVCGLMELAGGIGPGGEDRLQLVTRAIKAGVANEWVCGTREVVLARMRGEAAGPVAG